MHCFEQHLGLHHSARRKLPLGSSLHAQTYLGCVLAAHVKSVLVLSARRSGLGGASARGMVCVVITIGVGARIGSVCRGLKLNRVRSLECHPALEQ